MTLALAYFAALAVICGGIGLLRLCCWMNDPENFRQREAEIEKRMRADMAWQAEALKKAGGAAFTGAKILYKTLKK
ncbi:MAG TPA: hypothetical protein VN203_17040 [Candidatus Acidoferrum sp.]|nr:hypothetical protein [Candidatus Acidoferrum sp.]